MTALSKIKSRGIDGEHRRRVDPCHNFPQEGRLWMGKHGQGRNIWSRFDLVFFC
jgi:hypothetical protein